MPLMPAASPDPGAAHDESPHPMNPPAMNIPNTVVSCAHGLTWRMGVDRGVGIGLHH